MTRIYHSILIISLIILSLFFQERTHALTGRDVIAKTEALLRGDTQVAVYEITIKTRRWTRTLKMRSWENRKQKKSFSEITSPKKDAGNRFLLVNNHMMQFIPKLQKVIKISPSMMLQAWMGSDFSNDDIVKESSILEDYRHRIIGQETFNNFNCFKVELIPRPDAAVVWGKIIYYARVKDFLPVKEEFYNQHNVLKKVLLFSDYKRMHDRIIPTTYKMQTVRKKDRYTLLKISKVRFNINIPARTFTLQNLKRR